MQRHWKRRITRKFLKHLVSPLIHWEATNDVQPGYSIVLGTPWNLRELLAVNLKFVESQDLHGLVRVYVVFDRRETSGAGNFIESTKNQFANLPIDFSFHPTLLGRLLEKINQSKFYASTNWCLGLSKCRTKYAIMHDFDLYPLQKNFFRSIFETMKEKKLRFSGAEFTHYDGLSNEDRLIGTWELGVDAEWLRSKFRPIRCYHSVAKVNNRYVDLDAFSEIQSQTPERELAPQLCEQSFAHVRNLCSTYLRFVSGDPVNIAWRLHLLLYLWSLTRGEEFLNRYTSQMKVAATSSLMIEDQTVDFSKEHFTCANVLRTQVSMMEKSLYGEVRPTVERFMAASSDFFDQFGSHV
jgi:hypothetical protein